MTEQRLQPIVLLLIVTVKAEGQHVVGISTLIFDTYPASMFLKLKLISY